MAVTQEQGYYSAQPRRARPPHKLMSPFRSSIYPENTFGPPETGLTTGSTHGEDAKVTELL